MFFKHGEQRSESWWSLTRQSTHTTNDTVLDYYYYYYNYNNNYYYYYNYGNDDNDNDNNTDNNAQSSFGQVVPPEDFEGEWAILQTADWSSWQEKGEKGIYCLF